MRITKQNFRTTDKVTSSGSRLFESQVEDTNLSTNRGGTLRVGKLYTNASVESLIEQSKNHHGGVATNLFNALEAGIKSKVTTEKTIERATSLRKRDLINPLKIGKNIKTAKMVRDLPKTIDKNMDDLSTNLANASIGAGGSRAYSTAPRSYGDYHGNPVYYDSHEDAYYSPTTRHGDVWVRSDGRGGWTSG